MDADAGTVRNLDPGQGAIIKTATAAGGHRNDTTERARWRSSPAAGAGIGRATAKAFAREGARVVDRRNRQGGRRARPHISPATTRIAIRTDVTDEASMRAAIRTAVQQFGALHVLHNNAGGSTTARQHRRRSSDRGILARHQAGSVRHVPGLPLRHSGDHPIRRRLGHQHVVERRADGHCRPRLLHCREGWRRRDHPLDGGRIRGQQACASMPSRRQPR